MIEQSFSQGITIGSLLVNSDCCDAAANLRVTGLCLDSRDVSPGDLFIALPGSQADGLDYVDQAISRGAVAVAVDREVAGQMSELSVPVVPVERLSDVVSQIAANFYGDPSAQMTVTAVTGTNGKTSCCWLLSGLLDRLGESSAYLGTLGYGFSGVRGDQVSLSATHRSTLTTPDAIASQEILADLVSAGATSVAMEASSHALTQGRIAAVQVDTAVFTNLSRDHLDYHRNMQAYGDAKASLFEVPGLKHAVINLDDNWAPKLLGRVAQSTTVVTYSLDNPSADLYCRSIQLDASGIHAVLEGRWGSGRLYSPLVGQFNLANLLAVIAVAAQRYSLADILTAIPDLQAASGRMELIDATASPGVIVDYAHTPDALEKVLITLRAHSQGKLWVVFGCGGERDIGKRAKMGAIANRYADKIVLTNDNPRGESPQAIIAHIERGIVGDCSVELDRRMAIRHAVLSAAPEDLVLIAGKGHEDYQQIADHRLPFSDQVQARLALRDRGSGAT